MIDKKNKTVIFVKKVLTKKHKNHININGKLLYNYGRTEYISSSLKVIITCLEHGDFEQTPNSHLKGRGCPKCGSNKNGYTKSSFIERCNKYNNGFGILYVIRCFNDTESFYKVGITSKSIKRRYKDNFSMPYDYEVIYSIKSEPEIIYLYEKDILRLFSNNKYQPSISFAGETECFKHLEPIKKYLEIAA